VRLKLNHEVLAFGVIGLVNTVVDFGGYNALISLGALKANAASTLVAATSSYVMNRRWTYRDRPRSALHREYALFFLFNLAGLGIQEAVLGLAKYGLGFGEDDSRLALNLFKCAGIGVAMVFRFWAYRTFVFRPAPAAAAAVAAELDAELVELELAELELAELELETRFDGVGRP
jgi:putative flippase GtrA